MLGARGTRDYGSILLGSSTDSGFVQRLRVQTVLTASLVIANLVGAIVAIALASVGIPEPSVFVGDLWWVNFIAVPVYVVAAFVIGIGAGTVIVVRDLQWAIRDRRPTERDARLARRAPRWLLGIQGMLWLGAVILFTLCYGIIHPHLIPKVLFVVGMSGLVVVAVSYLLIEFAMRPVAAELISAGYGRRRRSSGVHSRSIVSWLVGSAIPIVGILLVVLFGAFRDETSKLDMFVGVAVLAVTALSTGLILTVLSSLSITGPIRSVRTGMHRVQAGDLDDAELVVYDGTELGDLQAGFNSMVGGLRERERMRDLFGRHVGRDVADAALASDPELGGTERVVAAMFVDVIGSTRLTAERTPTEVVEILNRFFAVIVGAVDTHRGLVNKFEGDAVLAVFGAPISLPDSAAAALATARDIADRLHVEVPELSAGIGIGYGPVVAGNVGAIERFEFTVIGDPVNESARLSELAKRDPRRPLASGRTIEAAATHESARWRELETVTLRGRAASTEVYELAEIGEPAVVGASATVG
ncbi:adenylate/guanylate cyclase domain-containing protein [Gordonia sp. NPDC003376]